MLERLIDEGVLQLSDQAGGPDGLRRSSVVSAETMDNLMRLRGAARLLHII